MGEYFTLALSKRGYVYSWGSNDKGQLGVLAEVAFSVEPVAVTSSKNTLSKAVA
jgi:alpha-tubulin suppressor-like RCC1 family protein